MKSLAILALAAAMGTAQGAQLFNNGAAVNANGLSILADDQGDYGFSAYYGGGFTLADNFTVSGGTWTVSDLDLFAYQPMAVTRFFFHTVAWSIVSGDINSGAVVASGITPVTNGGVVGYRVDPSNLSSTVRSIFDLKADITDVTLPVGNYWLTFSIEASENYEGPYVPPTVDGRVGNLMGSQYGGPFTAVSDPYSGDTFDVPFILNGTVAAVPEPATAAMWGVGLLGLALRRRQLRRRAGQALAGLGCALAVSASQATVTVYTSQAAFLAAVATPGVDTFNDLVETSFMDSPVTRSAGTYGYSVSSIVPGAAGDPGVVDGFYVAGTGGDSWLTTNSPTAVITFSGFAAGVNAVGGFFFTTNDGGNYMANEVMQISATDASGTIKRTVFNSTPGSFLGFVSSTGALTSVAVTSFQDVQNVWGTVNNLTLGSAVAAVPEPATPLMLLLGLGALAAGTRRRRSSQP